MKIINSLENSLIKSIVRLHTAKGRHEQCKFIAEGVRVCQALVQAQVACEHVLVTEDTLEQVEQLGLIADKLIQVTAAVMKKVSASTTPSGVLGVFKIPQVRVPEQLSSGLVLLQIADPGNMGTLIRTSVAFGLNQIIIIEGADPWQPKVVQSTAGTIGQAQIINMSWQELVAHTKRPELCALVPRGGEIIKAGIQPGLLVVGSEAHGIVPEWLAQCEQKLTLPMPGQAESLNAAITGAIALYKLFID